MTYENPLPAAGRGRGGRVHAELRIDAGSAAEARILAAALRVDDAGMAACRADGQHVVVSLTGTSARGILRGMDDVLECLRAARPTIAGASSGTSAPKASG